MGGLDVHRPGEAADIEQGFHDDRDAAYEDGWEEDEQEEVIFMQRQIPADDPDEQLEK